MVARHPGREELVTGLIRVGKQELTGGHEAEVDAYFAPDFAFHGPDGAELDYEGLKGYFASLRAAFDDLTISRGIMVVEGDYVACQTTITGTFVREFTHSPVGCVSWAPNAAEQVFPAMPLVLRLAQDGSGVRLPGRMEGDPPGVVGARVAECPTGRRRTSTIFATSARGMLICSGGSRGRLCDRLSLA